MEKTHEVEACEDEQEKSQSIRQVVNEFTPEQLQAGINKNLEDMVAEFVTKLAVLEEVVGHEIDIKIRAQLKDGRNFNLRVYARNKKK